MSYLPDSTLRACDGPCCTATYDAVTGPVGQSKDRRWRQHLTFGLHMCPDHAPLWDADSGLHLPRLDLGGTSASCSCGKPLVGRTLGDMTGAYLAHLAAADTEAVTP